MRPAWLWDKNISIKKIQEILKDPENERFVNMAALMLSRTNTPKEIFTRYLEQKTFVENWARIKRQMRKDSWNDPRIIFWQAVYEKLVEEFKGKGMALRPRIKDLPENALLQQVAQKIRMTREQQGLTQDELADEIGISQQIISRIEKGRNDVRLSTLEKIADALKIPIVSLLA